MPERTLTHVTSYTPRPPHGRVVQLRLKGTVWAWKCTALEAAAPAKQCLGFDACGWSACRGELDEVGTGRQPMFVLASSIVDSVPRGRARTKSRLRSTLWGLGSNSVLNRNTAARGRRTGASHRYRFKTFVCPAPPGVRPQKLRGSGVPSETVLYSKSRLSILRWGSSNGDGGRPALRAVSHRHGRSNVWDVQMRLPEDGARELEENIVRI